MNVSYATSTKKKKQNDSTWGKNHGSNVHTSPLEECERPKPPTYAKKFGSQEPPLPKSRFRVRESGKGVNVKVSDGVRWKFECGR